MIRFELRRAMMDYQARTGLRMSYEELSNDIDVSVETLKSIATRKNYNATFGVITKISLSLGIDPIEYFIWDVNELN